MGHSNELLICKKIHKHASLVEDVRLNNGRSVRCLNRLFYLHDTNECTSSSVLLTSELLLSVVGELFCWSVEGPETGIDRI